LRRVKEIAFAPGVSDTTCMPTATAPPEKPDAPTRTRWSLVRRLQAGDDERAWHEFYAAYGPLLQSLALRCGLSREEAEEAVQDTVTSVFKSLPGFKTDPAAGSFKNWLFRLARWRIINQFNRRPRDVRARAEPFPDRDGTHTATDPVGRLPDESPNALENTWDQEWRDKALGLALGRLKRLAKARHFQAFYLHVIKRQPPGQVARALGTNVAQVYLVKCRLLPVFKRIVRNLDRLPP
jgi:RNA polymerase sigma factor (sigma-70 family)